MLTLETWMQVATIFRSPFYHVDAAGKCYFGILLPVGKESTCHAGDPSSILGLGRSPREGIGCQLQYSWVLLVAQMKNLTAMQETWVQSLGWEDSLEKEKAREFHGLCSPWGRKESDMTE